MTVGGHIRLSDDWSIAVVYKCGSTSLKEGYRRAGYGFRPPAEPITSENTLIIVRHPLKRVISWWRNQVRDRGRVSNVHKPLIGASTDLNKVVEGIIALPDEQRDPHYRSYEAYIAPLENVHVRALEELSWPKGVPRHMKAGNNFTEGEYEVLDPELEKEFEREYANCYRIWREAPRGDS